MRTGDRITTSIADVWRRDDDVLVYDVCHTTEVTLHSAQETVQASFVLSEVPLPTLVLMRRIRKVEREARIYFARDPDTRRVSTRVALVAGTPVTRMIGNFFLGLNKPKLTPTRLFGTDDEALIWLHAD